MADAEKKPEGGGSSFGFLIPPAEPAKFLLWLFCFFLILFIVWWITGGPTRVQETMNPYAEPITTVGGTLQTYGAAGSQTPSTSISGWKTTSLNYFSVDLPPNWTVTITRNQSLVYRGTFSNGGATLAFDYGLYATPTITEGDPRYTESVERVNGVAGTFYFPKVSGDLTAVFFDRYPQNQSLFISGASLSTTQQQVALEIMRSVEFNN